MNNHFFDQSERYMEDKSTDNSSRSPHPPYPIDPCDDDSYLLGNSVNFCVTEHDSEIKADIVVGSRKSVRVWGQVRDCNSEPVACAYVKLLKVTPNGLVGVAHTMTDCQGFYQFDICVCKDGCNYTVIVGKAATGEERIVSTGLRGTNCNIPGPCNPCTSDPCNNKKPCDD